jgi:hypothetical protein
MIPSQSGDGRVVAVRKSHFRRNIAVAILVLAFFAVVVLYVGLQMQTFGCLGACGTYQISVETTSCSNGNGTCSLRLVNTGDTSGAVVGCTIGGGPGVLSPSPATVLAGESTNVACTAASGIGAGSGNSVQGTLSLQGGPVVPWASTWQ